MNFKWGIAFIVAILLVLSCSYGATYYYVNNVKHIITYASDQKIYDTSFKEQSSFKPGQSFIYHFHINYYVTGCYAEYVLNVKRINGNNVNYQFPWARTRQLVKKGENTNFDLDSLFTWPSDFPPGHYRFYQIAFPHCKGIDLDPFQTEIDKEVDIIK